MDTLINVVVVLAMIAIAAFVIHLLNTRHRHQHLRPAHYDHGLAGFGDGPASGPAPGTGPERTPGTAPGPYPGRRGSAEEQDATERRDADVSGSGTAPDTGLDTGPASSTGTGTSPGTDAGPGPEPDPRH